MAGDNASEHVRADIPAEAKLSDAEWIRKGIRATDEELEQLQPRYDLPEEMIILADLGHQFKAQAVIEEAKDSIEAGASGVHLHIQDEDGNETGDIDIWKEVLGEIKDTDPDIVVDGGLRGETFDDQMEFIREELFDVFTFNLVSNPEYIQSALEIVNEHDVLPRCAVSDTSDILLAKNVYIEPGLVETPALWSLKLGNPYKGVPISNPRIAARSLTFMIDQIKEIDPGAVIMVVASGVPASYLSALSVAMGHHVRIGMGETRWRYPHSEAKLQSNLDAITDAVSVARGIGRRPATSTEFREMIGL